MKLSGVDLSMVMDASPWQYLFVRVEVGTRSLPCLPGDSPSDRLVASFMGLRHNPAVRLMRSFRMPEHGMGVTVFPGSNSSEVVVGETAEFLREMFMSLGVIPSHACPSA